jgi:hypothetical protein
MKKIKLGDIFTIKTPKGKGYLHYVYKDKTVGDLIRVLPGLYMGEPENLNQLVSMKERYMIFFPLSAAYKQDIVEMIGNQVFDFSKPKYMRDIHKVRGEMLGWHIVDTDTWKMQLVKTLNEEQKKLSPWGIWNDTLLIQRLTEDWSLENWS